MDLLRKILASAFYMGPVHFYESCSTRQELRKSKRWLRVYSHKVGLPCTASQHDCPHSPLADAHIQLTPLGLNTLLSSQCNFYYPTTAVTVQTNWALRLKVLGYGRDHLLLDIHCGTRTCILVPSDGSVLLKLYAILNGDEV